MAAPAFTVVTGGAIALAATTPKTVLAVVPAANKAFTITAATVTFDGVTASAVPVLVEFCISSGATAGTSSAVTPNHHRGPGATVTASAAKNYTVEPTTIVPIYEQLLPPTSGEFVQLPLGREIECLGVTGATLGGFVIRCTAPAAVNVRATIEFEE